MLYLVYKITNTVNGMVYIGCHKTINVDDGYMGSGKYLKRALNKYGVENFKKEILFVFDTPEDMYKKERELVCSDFILAKNVYNLKLGGHGGFDHVNADSSLYAEIRTNNLQRITPDKWRELYYNCPEFRSKIDRNLRKAIGVFKQKYPNGTFLGRKHSNETKSKIGKKLSVAQSGENNSQYGTRWIHSLEEKRSMRIKKTDDIPDGWFEGRKIKF